MFDCHLIAGFRYKSLLCRVGSKRAIIAVARHLVILARRLVLDQSFSTPFAQDHLKAEQQLKFLSRKAKSQRLETFQHPILEVREIEV